jgi:hypothetical protein
LVGGARYVTKRASSENSRFNINLLNQQSGFAASISQRYYQINRMSQQSNQHAAPEASADMPPAMAEIKSQSADRVLQEMNRMPLFMTNLDETDGEGGENIALEALKALAYEGTRAEISENFRQQGNECARAKLWTDAKEFYDKALAALKGPQSGPNPDAAGPDVIEVELDEAEEAKKEKITEEACYVNRALCNLEKSESSSDACVVVTYRIRVSQ